MKLFSKMLNMSYLCKPLEKTNGKNKKQGQDYLTKNKACKIGNKRVREDSLLIINA